MRCKRGHLETSWASIVMVATTVDDEGHRLGYKARSEESSRVERSAELTLMCMGMGSAALCPRCKTRQ